MWKRRRVASTEEDGKHRDQHSSIDRISMLSDELLLYILSFLTLGEATATSALSSRWRDLWALSPKLDFDGTKLLRRVRSRKGNMETRLKKERKNYVTWVNQGLTLHKDFTIEEFRVFFSLSSSEKRHIFRWLRYALSRKVQRLVLNMKPIEFVEVKKYQENYTFPYKLLEIFSKPTHSWIMRQHNSIDFKYLREICMHRVNVNGEALEFFLCNCPVLEHLFISGSDDLSSLKIIGPFPAFKHLEISLCINLNSLEIRNVNLVCLKYIGSKIHFILDNVPMLTEIYVGGSLARFIKDVFLLLSSCLPQLEILTIDAQDSIVRASRFWKERVMFESAAKMSNLKQLVLKLNIRDEESLLSLTNICASPGLQRFEIVARHRGGKIMKREPEKIVRLYAHLKEVKLMGYHGKATESELVMHFVENAVFLEKIIIDPRKQHTKDSNPAMTLRSSCTGSSKLHRETKSEMNARTRARLEITKIVPPRIDLKIL